MALLAQDPGAFVQITLPRGETPVFEIEELERGPGWVRVSIRKDAGDDPDVTHLAIIQTTIAHGKSGQGIRFHAGPGVGTLCR